MKIKVKLLNNQTKVPKPIGKGEWIDLYANEDVYLAAPFANKSTKVNPRRSIEFNSKRIGLGIAMELPKGYEAIVLPRSSTYENFGVVLRNSAGVIDSSYCGNNDEWKFTAIALKDADIHKGDKIAQFRIQLSQFATIWQKIKWLFTNKIEFIVVDNLASPDRGGFGTTGKH